ncbi:MAG TPA: DUF2125 domain-containing protein [Stellaceae bacterium]|jgi:hypothetical protein
MRRPARLGLIAAILLVIGVGGYSVFWRIAAGRIADGAAQWAASMRTQGVDASWQTLAVGGYPFSFRIEFTSARIVSTAPNLAGELTAPRLIATVGAGNLHAAALATPQGLSLSSEKIASLKAKDATGMVAAGRQGGAAIWLRLTDATGTAAAWPGAPAIAKTAQVWLELPAAPPKTDTDRNIAIALDLAGLSVPLAPQELGGSIDDAAIGLTVMGPIPPGPARQAATGWRDAGGTIELDHLHLGWGGVDLDAKGTLALDRDLQPEGSLSGSLGGYDKLLRSLVSGGQVKGSNAGKINLLLGLLARPGPDGKPRLPATLTLEDGILSMGPITFGRVPKIDWGK